MAFKCDPEAVKNQREYPSKETYNPDKKRTIDRKIEDIHRTHKIFEKGLDDAADQAIADAAQRVAFYDDLWKQRLGEVYDLDGNKYNAVQQFMADKLNQRAKMMGMSGSLEYTPAGEVGNDILDGKRIVKDMIDTIAKAAGSKKAKELNDLTKHLFQKYGVGDKNLQAALRFDAIELGGMARNAGIYKVGQAGASWSMAKYDRFLRELETLGFQPEDIERLITKSSELAEVFDDVRYVAIAAGVDVGQVEGLDYIMRSFVPEMKRYLDRINAKEQSAIYDMLSPMQGKIQTFKSRKTFEYIPESIDIVAEKLGVTGDDVRRMVDDGTIVKEIHEKLNQQQLEALVDSGALSQLPMTTREVYDYIVTQYQKLPFKGMADVFRDNPEQILSMYTEQLKKSVEASAMSKVVFEEGVKKNWAFPSSVWHSMSKQPQDFVPIDADTIRQFYPGYKGEDMFVHKTVDRAWKSQMTIATNPEMLSTAAGLMNYFSTFLTRSALMNGTYAPRILWDAIRNTGAAGGNLLRLPEGYSDLIKIKRHGFDKFDNTKKAYLGMSGELVTEKQFMEEVARFRLDSAMPGVAGIEAGHWADFLRPFDPRNVGKSTAYAIEYLRQFGPKEAIQYLGSQAQNVQADLFAPIGAAGNFFESGAKLATIKSLAYRGEGAKIGQWALNPLDYGDRFDKLEDVFRHVDNYFLPWDDVGTGTRAVSTWVRPFASFAMSNPPAQIRQMMRRPREFINYWRIQTFILGTSDIGDEDLNEATIPDWMMDSSPGGFWETEPGKFITILNSSWDSRREGWTFLQETSETIGRATGWYVGTTEEQRQQIYRDFKGRQGLLEFFAEGFRETHKGWQIIAELVTGVDVETGRSLEHGNVLQAREGFLGVNMPVMAKYFLEVYPPLGRLDTFNPGDIFGRPEIRDPVTNELIVEPKAGWAGGRREDVNRADKYTDFQGKRAFQLLQHLGFNPKIVDTARNMQFTHAEVERMQQEMIGAINSERRRLIEEEDAGLTDAEYNRRAEIINNQIDSWARLRYDLDTIEIMMQERGIPKRDAFSDVARKYYDMQLKYGRPAPGDDKIRDVIQQAQELYVEPRGE